MTHPAKERSHFKWKLNSRHNFKASRTQSQHIFRGKILSGKAKRVPGGRDGKEKYIVPFKSRKIPVIFNPETNNFVTALRS